MARVLIVGGGCPGRRLAARLTRDGHAVRITTRDEARRAAIEDSGAECWLGTPDRLATLRGALDHVTVACWMLAGARGEREQLSALHESRLQFFLTQAIDTTVRGVLYDATPRVDAAGERDGVGVAPQLLAAGARTVAQLTERNAIPAAVLETQPLDGTAGADDAWATAADAAIAALLAGRAPAPVVERG